jgi:cell division initiation protein
MRKDKVVSEVFGEEVALTPSDLYSKQFKTKAFGGYEPKGVHSFLERVADVLEDLIVQVRVLKEQNAQLDERLEEYRQMEETLRNALVSSRNFGEDILESAKREAHTLVEEARLVKAHAHLEAAKIPATLSRDIQLLEGQRQRLRVELVSILETHHKLLDSLVPEPTPTENLAIDVPSAEEAARMIEEAEKAIDTTAYTPEEPETSSEDEPDVEQQDEDVEEAPSDTEIDADEDSESDAEEESGEEGADEDAESVSDESGEAVDAESDSDATSEADDDMKAAASGIMLSTAERALLTDSEVPGEVEGDEDSEESDDDADGEDADDGEEDDAEGVIVGEPLDEADSDAEEDDEEENEEEST